MAGKNCTGAPTNNADLIKESRAFCEGMYHRSLGPVLSFPITDNPHVATSQAGVAWDAGWTVANDITGGIIAASDAPCCAKPLNIIPV